MFVKDLIKQLESLPQDYIVGFTDEKETDIIYPNGKKVVVLNNLEIVLIH